MQSFTILPDSRFEDQIEFLFSNYAECYLLSGSAAPMLNPELLFSLGHEFRIGDKAFNEPQQANVEFFRSHPTAQPVESSGEHWTFGVIFKPWALTLMECCGNTDLRRLPVSAKMQVVKNLFINEFRQSGIQPTTVHLHDLSKFISDKLAFRAPGETIRAILDELKGVRASGRPIDSITNRVGISHKSVIASFKNHIGVTPLRFVHHHAVLNSLADLQDGAIPIAQVALDNGFYDQSHFNRIFKSFMLMSAGRYRQGCLEGKFCPIKA
jgi:AraC-like DNA-binding protein